MSDLKLKNVSSPLELLKTLRDSDDNITAAKTSIEKMDGIHSSLNGSSFYKEFKDLSQCTLLQGSCNLSNGVIYC